MKKFIYVLLVGVLCLPLLVNADMGAPETLKYQAVVINKEGAKYYSSIDLKDNDYVGTLEYNSKITIIEETSTNDNEVGTFSKDNKYYYLKIDDITAVLKDFDLSYAYKLDNAISGTVLVSNIEVYSGPNFGYSKKSMTIPKGTTVSITYRSTEEKPYSWYYITYKGKSGWVYSIGGVIGIKNSNSILTVSDTKLYDAINVRDKGKVIATIPKDTVIKGYYDIDDWSQGYYVEYKDYKGYVSSLDVAISGERYSIKPIIDNVKLYKDAAESSDVLENSVTKDTYYPVLYTYNYNHDDGWFQISYNNKVGWVHISYNPSNINVSQSSDISTPVTIKVPTTKTTTRRTYYETMSKKEIILFCVAGALLVAVIALSIILLVNNKKKEKNL